MPETTREIRLAARPEGEPTDDAFDLREVDLPEPGEGEVLVRNSYLSVDPYMRGRMRDVKSYVPPFEVGAVMDGGAVGQIVASRNEGLAEGTWVLSMEGWREHYVTGGKDLTSLDPGVAPVSTALGVLGMPGLTAWVGLTDIAHLTPDDTVFVSGAAGAVGSAVGQIARLRGARVIGSAGSAEKVEWLTGELGFDAAFDYKSQKPSAALREHAPDGIDVYFDNVGGDHLDAALAALNTHGRVAICGAISGYNSEQPPPGPRNFAVMIPKRLSVRGFLVFDHQDRMGAFREEVGAWVRDGSLRYEETIVDGIERMPEAFLGLFKGENRGKMLVRVGPDPD